MEVPLDPPSEPWLRHPSGVWVQHARDDGSSVLVDFGGELRIAVSARVWPAPPEGEQPAGTVVDGRRVHFDAVDAQGEVRVWRARTWLTTTEVVITLADAAELSDEQALALLREATTCVDYDAIALRSTPPAPYRPAATDLVPWLLLPDHPGAEDLGCAVLPNGLWVAIAAIHPPHAHLIGSAHALVRALSSEELVRLAVANLVDRLGRGEIPTAVRAIGETRTLAIGPHLLANACLLLPDLRLWAEEVLDTDGELFAVPLRQDLLLVVPTSVERPDDGWAPALRLT